MSTLKIDIKNDEGKIIKSLIIKRTFRKNLSDLIDLQKNLLEYFCFSNISIGAMLSDDVAWDIITNMSKLVPLVPEGNLADHIEELESDYDFIVPFFLSNSWNKEIQDLDVVEAVNLKPSGVSSLNCLDYLGDLGKVIGKIQVEMMKSRNKNAKQALKLETDYQEMKLEALERERKLHDMEREREMKDWEEETEMEDLEEEMERDEALVTVEN